MDQVELTVEQKVKLASSFIVDSPPGEFHEVLNDIRVLIENDGKLQAGAKSAVHQYNTSQFIVVKLNDESKAIISKYSEIDENTFYCPKTMQKFTFDHVRQQATDIQPHSANSSTLRKAIEFEVEKYVCEHYPENVVGVYDEEDSVAILIASNKYNPSNFWNGRWRSEWIYDLSSGKLSGTIRVHVHYYEDGNVQFDSEFAETIAIGTGAPESIATTIAQKLLEIEEKYQNALNENYAQLSDTTFKGLRRALPVTKSKLDWNKILSYKLGSNLSR